MNTRMTATIRLATVDDAAAMLAIYAPVVRATTISFELEPPSLDEFRRRVADTLAARPWLVCEDRGAILGYAYASAYRARAAYQWCVETSVYVAPASQGQGIGRGLYRSLFALLALQGYYNAYAVITLPNPASVGLHTALAFRPIGVFHHVGYKLGRWHDVAWYVRDLQPDRTSPPAPPRPLAVLAAEPAMAIAWEAAMRASEENAIGELRCCR